MFFCNIQIKHRCVLIPFVRKGTERFNQHTEDHKGNQYQNLKGNLEFSLKAPNTRSLHFSLSSVIKGGGGEIPEGTSSSS